MNNSEKQETYRGTGIIDESAFVADGVKIVGDVNLGENCSVWFNSVLRASGDTKIVIGKGTNIQDNCTFHSSNDMDVIVGDNVTIGHNALVHCCTIESNCLIGMGAIIMNEAVIRENSIVGGGALVTGGKEFPPGSLIIGNPAKAVRQVNEAELEMIKDSVEEYIEEAKLFLSSE